jgi:hypothetical protein
MKLYLYETCLFLFLSSSFNLLSNKIFLSQDNVNLPKLLMFFKTFIDLCEVFSDCELFLFCSTSDNASISLSEIT